MTQPDPRLLARLAPNISSVPRPPTPEELAELEKVRAMQVRTEAIKLAVQLAIVEKGVDDTMIVDLAKVFEIYINGWSSTDAPQT